MRIVKRQEPMPIMILLASRSTTDLIYGTMKLIKSHILGDEFMRKLLLIVLPVVTVFFLSAAFVTRAIAKLANYPD